MEENKEEKKVRIIKPQPGLQEKLIRSNVDVCFSGGSAGGGKTYGVCLLASESSLDPNFRGIYVRRNKGDLTTTGGVVDTFKDIFGNNASVKMSDTPRITFASGAYIECRQIADESYKKVSEQWKGVAADLIVMEEITGFEWTTFTYLMSRNRGRAKWSNKMRATLNPKKSHWTRIWLDWYIGPDGFIIEERDGVVRYFYMAGETVKDVVWGDTKEEVYKKCKIDIDRKLKKLGGTVTYEQMIKSFTFYQGKISENKALLANNEGYVGSIAATGGKNAQMLIEGNFNVDEHDESESPISQTAAREVFLNDKMTNGDRWVTVDLAEEGTDNFLAIAWDGFHILDVLIQGRTTPRRNAELIAMFAKQYDVGDSHIIYDAANGKYINDYIPEAIPFISYSKTIGVYMFNFQSLKDECYDRLVKTIKEGRLSCEESVGDREYTHQKIKSEIPISTEFVEECSVVRFKTMPSGKKKLYNKKEMNAMLGKGRSMDLLDPCAMRMMPVLHINVGEELVETASARQDDDYYSPFRCNANVYTDDFWA